MRRNAFLEMLWPPDDLATADKVALSKSIGELVGRDLADSPSILLKQVRALSRHDTYHRLTELAKIPTLVLSAKHDLIALPRYGQALANGIPGAKFECIPRSSHGVTIQHEAKINELLLGFLKTNRSIT